MAGCPAGRQNISAIRGTDAGLLISEKPVWCAVFISRVNQVDKLEFHASEMMPDF